MNIELSTSEIELLLKRFIDKVNITGIEIEENNTLNIKVHYPFFDKTLSFSNITVRGNEILLETGFFVGIALNFIRIISETTNNIIGANSEGKVVLNLNKIVELRGFLEKFSIQALTLSAQDQKVLLGIVAR